MAMGKDTADIPSPIGRVPLAHHADYGLVPQKDSAFLDKDATMDPVTTKKNSNMLMIDRTESNSIVPDMTRCLLQSRVDNQDMLEWQEGGGETLRAVEEGAAGQEEEMVSAPPPRKYDHPTICGIDKRPFFPAVLILSLLWSMCMMSLQSLVVAQLFGSSSRCNTFFTVLYVFTIGSAVYTSLANPGLMPQEHFEKWQAGERSLPSRAHKHWLYKRPVLRFHQYCRWVTNAVGLQNHRSYMCMLFGFVAVAVCDALMDIVLIPAHFTTGTWTAEILLLVHFFYSCYFAWYASPLLRQHSQFIGRNELTQEWKKDEFYVVYHEVTGEKVAVTDLETEDYNRLFDEFVYDPSRNPFDKGWVQNCLTFWFTDRSDPNELGEF